MITIVKLGIPIMKYKINLVITIANLGYPTMKNKINLV